MTARIPVTLLAGFLGSGKTTLLNRILSAPASELPGGPCAVIVNEFGEVGIDGKLVVGARDEVIELSNGCLCCTVRGDLAETIAGLLARRARRLVGRVAFDRILVEASGMASPGPIAQTLVIVPELARAVVLDGVVTLAHAVHAARDLAQHAEAAEQAGYADRIVLNACDLASEGEMEAAERALRACNALAPIQRAVRADLPIAPLLAIGAREPGAWKLAERAPRGPAGSVHARGVAEVRTFTLRATRPLDIHRLKIWLQFVAAQRSHELLRLKGILACEGIEHAVVVQGVHQWLELGPGAGAPPQESVLVLIGRGLDPGALERGWRTVTGPEPA